MLPGTHEPCRNKRPRRLARDDLAHRLYTSVGLVPQAAGEVTRLSGGGVGEVRLFLGLWHEAAPQSELGRCALLLLKPQLPVSHRISSV
jgi:hypothetical protein